MRDMSGWPRAVRQLVKRHARRDSPVRSPHYAAQCLKEALAYLQKGDRSRAEQLLERLKGARLHDPDTLGLYGQLLQDCGRSTEAVPLLERVVQLAPNVAAHWCNLGAARQCTGNLGAALQAYRRAIALNPGNWQTYFNIGHLLEEQKEYAKAESFLRLSVQRSPENCHTWAALARLCARQGHLNEAVSCFEKSLRIEPTAVVWSNLAQTYSSACSYEQALAAARKAIALDPQFSLAFHQAGTALAGMDRLCASKQAFEAALILDPKCVDAMEGIAIVATMLANPEEALQWQVRAMEAAPARGITHSSMLFTLSTNAVTTPERLLEAHVGWAQMHASKVPVFRHAPPMHDSIRKLRIGFVSGDFRDHPVRFFIAPILRNLDRGQFEVICYSNCPYADSATEQLRPLADEWHEIADTSDEELASQIRDQRIDILVDLSGHTQHNRLLMFARKPAPLQVTYLGYPGTTGLAQMDYWVTDWILHPRDTAQRTTERIWRLPRCWVIYEPPVNAPEVGPRTSGGPLTFASFNASRKLSVQSFRLWAGVLAALPESHLLIKAHGLDGPAERDIMMERAVNAGLTPERVTLIGRVKSRQAHLALYEGIDVALDTTPFSGGTTTAEALWMGVPVVTLPGSLMCSRMSASMLHAVALDDCIARNEDDFIRTAVDLALDVSHRAQLRRELRARVAASPLCDGPGLAREAGKAFRQMWTLWCQSREPDTESRVLEQQDLSAVGQTI